MTLRNTAIITIKLAISGLIIFAFGAIFLVISSDGDVSPAQADLYDFQPGILKQHQDFGRVMEDSGLEPRPYDYNGNIVNFAVGDSELEPRELLTIYQERFKEAGINSEAYLEPDFASVRTRGTEGNEGEMRLRETDAFLDGEVVPISVNDNHVAMASLVSDVDLDGAREEFGQALQFDRGMSTEQIEAMLAQTISNHDFGDIDFEKGISAFRFLEAHRDANTGQTTVTATWSDGDFDSEKISDPEAVNNRLDTEIPVCIGCTRNNRIEALEESEPYVLNQFHTTSSSERVRNFYHSALTRRGWKASDTSSTLDNFAEHIPELHRLRGDVLNFERDGESVTIYLREDHEALQTNVLTMMEEAS